MKPPMQQPVINQMSALSPACEPVAFQLAGSLRRLGYRVYGDACEGVIANTKIKPDTLVLSFTREEQESSSIRSLLAGHRRETILGRVSIHFGRLKPGLTVYVQVYGRENLREVTLWAEQFAREHGQHLKVSLATEKVHFEQFPSSWRDQMRPTRHRTRRVRNTPVDFEPGRPVHA